MGASLGFSANKGSASGTQSESNTYSAGQTQLQNMLSEAFSKLLPGITNGGMSPNVTALQTQGADAINKTSATTGDRVNRFLAARGFGQSGRVGKAALSTELGRQSALATNNSNAAGLQLQQNDTLLSDALAAAYAKIGQTGASTGNSSGYGFGGGVGFGKPGLASSWGG